MNARFPQQGSGATPGGFFAWVAAVLVLIILVIGVFVGGLTGCKAWNRSQKRADAHNAVKLTGIQIENQRAYAKVIEAHNGIVKAQAYQRYLQAVGIREAQDEISKTLTPFYLQHEAIEAQKAVATSGKNNTIVYVPSGNNGVPLALTQNASKP